MTPEALAGEFQMMAFISISFPSEHTQVTFARDLLS